MVTAREINEKQFHDAWRGYNQEEVDDFLDRVAEAIDALQRENDDLHGRLQELDQKIESSKTSEAMLKKTLESAQVAAEEAISAAKKQADEIVRDAEERAQRARDELKTRVETAEEEVRRRTAEVEREQEGRRREIQESVDRLQAFESDLKRKLHGFMEQQRASLEILEDNQKVNLVATEEAADSTFDAAEEEELPDDPADSLVVEPEAPAELDLIDATGEFDVMSDISDEPNLDDFAPYDEEEAFGPSRRKRRGIFRRDKEPEVSSEEV